CGPSLYSAWLARHGKRTIANTRKINPIARQVESLRHVGTVRAVGVLRLAQEQRLNARCRRSTLSGIIRNTYLAAPAAERNMYKGARNGLQPRRRTGREIIPGSYVPTRTMRA